MAQADGRVEQLERKIDSLATVIGTLSTDVAVLSSAMVRVERDIAADRIERVNIAKEVGAYGIQMTKFVAGLAHLETTINAIQPTVAELTEEHNEREGAAKLASKAANVGKALYAMIAGVATGIVTSIGWLWWLFNNRGR